MKWLHLLAVETQRESVDYAKVPPITPQSHSTMFTSRGQTKQPDGSWVSYNHSRSPSPSLTDSEQSETSLNWESEESEIWNGHSTLCVKSFEHIFEDEEAFHEANSQICEILDNDLLSLIDIMCET